jgi:hypothetical protein
MEPQSERPDRIIKVTVSERYHQEAKTFLDFLQRAAKKHSQTFSISSSAFGEFNCSVPFKELEQFDLFLQELMLDHGLYYYLCTVSDRRELERFVVRPVFRDLLASCYPVILPSLIRRHLLEGYEKLFQQLKLKLISGYEFIRNLDDLLTAFMLFQLGHKKGQKSPNFSVLLAQCGKMDMRFLDPEIRKLFNQIHSLRTRGLHRMEREIPDADLSRIALRMYVFFEYLDDFFEAQDKKTVKLSGKRYRRIRYGYEHRHWKGPLSKESKVRLRERANQPCHDCGVLRGELHVPNCDWELCPRCSGQYMSCDCIRDDEE